MNEILPDSIPLARWAAPSWATSTTLDGVVSHTRRTEPVPTLPDRDDAPAGDLDAVVWQSDDVVVEDGRIRVVRQGDPVVMLDGIRMTLAAAHNLGARLCQLVEDVEAAIDPDEACGVCGTARGEHPAMLAHPWVSVDELDAR